MSYFAGLEIRGCREPSAPLNSPAAPSNLCREPKNVLVSIHNTCKWLRKMQLGSLVKLLISSPALFSVVNTNGNVLDIVESLMYTQRKIGKTYYLSRLVQEVSVACCT